MIDKILVRLFASEWRIILIVSLLLLALAETGFQVAQRRHRETTDAHRSQVTGIQTAVLGLLALLLGFTFAMALGRYGLRRNLVLQEANAIGTTYLRASFLPETHTNAVEGWLRRNVELRLPLYEGDTSQAILDPWRTNAPRCNANCGRMRSQQGEKLRRRLLLHSLTR